jgi:aldose 1-epimerase
MANRAAMSEFCCGGMILGLLLTVVPACSTQPAPQAESGAEIPSEPETLSKSKVRSEAESELLPTGSEGTMRVTVESFGQLADGRAVKLFTCRNENGLVLKLTDYGAIVVAFEVPDRDGNPANINLGFSELEGYLQRHPYFGSTVGRYCNRIAGGKFTLDGQEYNLAKNNGENHLHGGLIGFDRVLWNAEVVEAENAAGVRFTYRSPDGDEGYPGNLDVSATYLLTADDELQVEFQASSDQATPVNLTNHCYWNLAGAGRGDILAHEATIEADRYLAVDDNLIPTGELAPVAGTPLDFRAAQPIGARLGEITSDPPGYDHCYVLRGDTGELRLAARVKDPVSGRVMEVLTTQPGIQFYTGNFLSGDEATAGFGRHAGFCLETQHYPDSPNQPDFPSTILRPGETYRQQTVHRFSVDAP